MLTLVSLFQVQSLLIDVSMQLLKNKIILRNVHKFSHQIFPKKTTPFPFAHNTDEKNQALKLLFATATVDLVVQFDLWVRKCSSFIFVIMLNTLL